MEVEVWGTSGVMLVHNPPFKFYIFVDWRIEAGSKCVFGTAENLEVLIFATFGDSNVDLGVGCQVGVGNGNRSCVGR